MCDSRCAAERKNDLQMAQRCFCSMPDPEEPVDPGEDVCGGLGGEKLYFIFSAALSILELQGDSSALRHGLG